MSKQDDYKSLSSIAHQWRDVISRPDVTAAEHKAFEAWISEDIRHESAFDRAETYWAAFDHLQPADIDADLMPPHEGRALRQWLEQARASLVSSTARYIASASVAACVFMTVIFNQQEVGPVPLVAESAAANFETSALESKRLILDDGTEVTLGAKTQIDVVMSLDARQVSLRGGAAYFDVAHDESRPFIVTVGELSVTALGTEFDVRNNGGMTRVAVAQGRVEVEYPFLIDGKRTGLFSRQTLDVGQQVAANLGSRLRKVTAADPKDIGAWRRDVLVYDEGTVGELVADLNRYTNREIVLDASASSLHDQTITASFNATRVDRILSMLVLSYPLEIDNSEPTVVRLRYSP
ncbi:MAG: FecR domain-containing protein [Pseudomonadota bacterium]